MNLYELVNEEMKRLYLEMERNRENWARNSGSSFYQVRHNEAEETLRKFRDAILDQFKNHDQKIQEKIAELALTGSTDE